MIYLYELGVDFGEFCWVEFSRMRGFLSSGVRDIARTAFRLLSRLFAEICGGRFFLDFIYFGCKV